MRFCLFVESRWKLCQLGLCSIFFIDEINLKNVLEEGSAFCFDPFVGLEILWHVLCYLSLFSDYVLFVLILQHCLDTPCTHIEYLINELLILCRTNHFSYWFKYLKFCLSNLQLLYTQNEKFITIKSENLLISQFRDRLKKR